jgi:Secretion system C-terminal sorting domain
VGLLLILHNKRCNPASDVVFFQCQNPSVQDITIRIYDINGKEITEISDKNAAIGEWNKALDMTALSSGVYFCKWQVGNIRFVQKLLK